MTNLREMLSKFINSNTASSLSSGTLPSQTVTNSREHINAIITRSGKTCEGPSTPHFFTPVVSTPLKEPKQNPETSMDKVQKPGLESTAQVLPPKDQDSIFIEIPKPRAKKIVQEPNSLEPNSYQPKLPYPERMKVREKDKPSAQQSREKLEEIAITTVNAECSAIILNKVHEKLEDPGIFLILCALQELDRTNALADSGASIHLLPHSIYKQLGLGALKSTRMTLELANRSVKHPMGRPFLRIAKSLIDLYEEKLTLRVGSDELVFYAEKSEKSKNKQFAHAISVIDFSKDEPFSGSTTNHSVALPPNSSPVKTSDNLEEFVDEPTLLKKGVHEENFQVYSSPLFEFDDNFNSSNENPLFNEIDEDVENKNSNVLDSDEPISLLVTENVHANPSSIIASPIPIEDRDPVQEEIDIFLVLGDLIPPGIQNDDSEDEDNSTFLPDHELPNLDHQDNPSSPRPPPEPPDMKIHLEPDTAVINNFDVSKTKRL
ncbi:reverse transcriptase domain-containing protein, partial [Tanacetum coccineum]